MPPFTDVVEKIYFFFDSPNTPPGDHKKGTLASVLYLLRRELIETAGYDPAAGGSEDRAAAEGVQRRLFASLIVMFTGFDILAKFQFGDKSGEVGKRFIDFLRSTEGPALTETNAKMFYAIRKSMTHAFGVPDADMLQKLGMTSITVAQRKEQTMGDGTRALVIAEQRGDVAVVYIDGVYSMFKHAVESYHDTLFGAGSADPGTMFEKMFDKYGTINWV